MIEEMIDSIKSEQRVFANQYIRDQSVLEEIDIKIHYKSILNELIQGFDDIFLLIMLLE